MKKVVIVLIALLILISAILIIFINSETNIESKTTDGGHTKITVKDKKINIDQIKIKRKSIW